MDSGTHLATTSTVSGGATITTPPDLVTPLVRHFSNTTGFNTDSLLSTLQTTWSVYTIIAYLISLVLLYIFIYASIRASHLEAAMKEIIDSQREAYLVASGADTKQVWWQEIQEHAESTNPNDWKQAIIQADVLLDDTLKRMGFSGVSLGERLRSITPDTLRTIDDAWAAHKVRNQVAHSGADFVLTQKMTKDAIARYRSVFQELGIL